MVLYSDVRCRLIGHMSIFLSVLFALIVFFYWRIICILLVFLAIKLRWIICFVIFYIVSFIILLFRDYIEEQISLYALIGAILLTVGLYLHGFIEKESD